MLSCSDLGDWNATVVAVVCISGIKALFAISEHVASAVFRNS